MDLSQLCKSACMMSLYVFSMLGHLIDISSSLPLALLRLVVCPLSLSSSICRIALSFSAPSSLTATCFSHCHLLGIIALSSYAQSLFDPKFAFCTSLCPVSSVYHYILLALAVNTQTMVSSNATLPSISTFPPKPKHPAPLPPSKQYTQPAYT
jgi:hypothetical protein